MCGPVQPVLLCALRLQIWSCSQDESNHIVHRFFESDHFNDGIPVIPGAVVSGWRPLCSCHHHQQQRPVMQRPLDRTPVSTMPWHKGQSAGQEHTRRIHQQSVPSVLWCVVAGPAGAYETLCRLQQSCDLVVVTSRQHVIQDLTLEWLDRHYRGLFEEVYFGNHFALQGASRKKSDICK